MTFGTTTETYDLNGNLATSTDAGVTTTYTWNARNQLTGITKTGFTASFTYGSFGRRTGRTVNGVVTNYVYDGLNPVQEKNGATVTANLLTGLGIDEFFTRTEGGTARSLLPDVLGSTIALGDGTGTLQTQYTYEPFGVVSQTGAASTSSYKFTGREDDGSGLFYYRARYYQPRLQRFIAEDPIGFSNGSFNVYSYASNNPLVIIDPFGLQDQWYGYNDPAFQDWAHKTKQQAGRRANQNFSKDEVKNLYKQWLDEGQPRGKGGKSGKGGQWRGLRCLWWLNMIALGLDALDAMQQYQQCQNDPCFCDEQCS